MYKIESSDYVKALNAGSLSSYIPIEDAEKEMVCNTTPEDILISKQIFSAASDEAKSVISIILNAPANILDALCIQNSTILSRKKIKKYVRLRTGLSKKEVETAFDEIKLRLAVA